MVLEGNYVFFWDEFISNISGWLCGGDSSGGGSPNNGGWDTNSVHAAGAIHVQEDITTESIPNDNGPCGPGSPVIESVK